MENCLVTKLKATVNDDNLEKLGVIKIAMYINSTSNRLVSAYAKDGYSCDLKITNGDATINYAVGGCVKVDSKNAVINQAATGSNYNGFTINGTDLVSFDVEITNKYYLGALTRIGDANFNNFKRMDSLETAVINGSCTGDISVFAQGCPNLVSFSYGKSSNQTFTGNMLAFGNNIYLKNISLTGGLIFSEPATLEQFVALQRAAGRTDTSASADRLSISSNAYFFTFNGTDQFAPQEVPFYWTATTITVGSTTINA